MAGERTLPGIGLTGFWNLGDSSWKPGMDANLRALSALVQLSVLSRQTAIPDSPADGSIYIVPANAATNANRIAIRDNGATTFVTPAEGWLGYVKDEDLFVKFNGTVWEVLATGGGGGGGGSASITPGKHRYWRINILNIAPASNQFIRLRDIEFAGVAGGPDLTVPAEAATRAFAQSGTGTAANAFDASTSNQWDSGVPPLPKFIGWDFGAGTEVEILEARLIQNESEGHTLTHFAVQYSDNFADWTTAWEWKGTSLPDILLKTQHFTAKPPVSGRDHTGTADTFVSDDANNIVTSNSASPVTQTIPSGAFPLWTTLTVIQKGVGAVQWVGASGVTITPSRGMKNLSAGQWATMTATQIAANQWLLAGQFEAV